MNIQDMSETCWEKAGLTCCSDSLCTTCQLALFATSIFVDQPLQGKALVIPHQLKDEIFQLTEGLVSTGLVWSRVFCRLFIFLWIETEYEISAFSIKPWPWPSNSLMKQSKYKMPHMSIVHLDNTMVFRQISNAKGNPDV